MEIAPCRYCDHPHPGHSEGCEFAELMASFEKYEPGPPLTAARLIDAIHALEGRRADLLP